MVTALGYVPGESLGVETERLLRDLFHEEELTMRVNNGTRDACVAADSRRKQRGEGFLVEWWLVMAVPLFDSVMR